MKTKRGKVILLRGISGSGKSTHVDHLRHKYQRDTGTGMDFFVCSADKYFMRTVPTEGGTTTRQEYVFDPYKLPQAHSACFSEFVEAMKAGTKVIVVDNTFIHHWEFKGYLKTAEMAGYDLEVHEIRVDTIEQLKVCIKRNVHRVPAEAVTKMAVEFEPMSDSRYIVINIPFH